MTTEYGDATGQSSGSQACCGRAAVGRTQVFLVQSKALSRRAGISPDRPKGPGIGIHSLRKTADNNAEKNGAGVHEIQELLVHKIHDHRGLLRDERTGRRKCGTSHSNPSSVRLRTMTRCTVDLSQATISSTTQSGQAEYSTVARELDAIPRCDIQFPRYSRGPSLVVLQQTAQALVAHYLIGTSGCNFIQNSRLIGRLVSEPLVRSFFMEMD